MASSFEDWTWGGLKARVWFRLQKLPMFTEPMRGLAVNRGIRDLWLFIRRNVTILEAKTFIIGVGEFANQVAAEYPLPANTLWVNGVNLDGFPLEGPIAEEEMQNTGMERGQMTSGVRARCWLVRVEEDGSSTLVLWPRPQVNQLLQVFGGVAPDYLDDDTQVPIIGEVFGDAIEFFAVAYCLAGQEGMEVKQEKFQQMYERERAKAKLGMRLGRVSKTRRSRLQ